MEGFDDFDGLVDVVAGLRWLLGLAAAAVAVAALGAWLLIQWRRA